jgi:hypothetical protein
MANNLGVKLKGHDLKAVMQGNEPKVKHQEV